MNAPESSGGKPQLTSTSSKRPAKRARKEPVSKENSIPKDGSSGDKNPEDIKEIPPASGKCYLLDELPPEVRNYIWKLSVTVDDPIVPIQLCRKSNKFLWSTSQLVKDDKGYVKKKISAVKPLTAVQLTQVCHQIYDEVSNTHLFYSLNEFNFLDAEPNDPVTYLLAITEPRRNAIRSITCEWQRYYQCNPAQMFTVLAACDALQVLEIKIAPRFTYHYRLGSDHSKFPGLTESKVAVRGIKKLTLELRDYRGGYLSRHKEGEALCRSLEFILVKEVAKPRGNEYNLKIFAQAQLDANLDVHGSGRLSGDKRPNVASRTRQQLRNVDKLTDQGTMPRRETPKYDLNGDLAWYVLRVEDSRKILSDDGGSSVEFRVRCYPESDPGRYPPRTQDKEVASWEAVSVLHSASAHWDIVQFYSKHRDAFGKQETRDVWKLRSEDDEKVARQHANALKQLNTLINKEVERREAVRLAREAKIEKQNAKATKTVAKPTAAAKKGTKGSKAGRRY